MIEQLMQDWDGWKAYDEAVEQKLLEIRHRQWFVEGDTLYVMYKYRKIVLFQGPASLLRYVAEVHNLRFFGVNGRLFFETDSPLKVRRVQSSGLSWLDEEYPEGQTFDVIRIEEDYYWLPCTVENIPEYPLPINICEAVNE